MSEPLTAEKREELFQQYFKDPHVRAVARVCHVSTTTVSKYKKHDQWDKRVNDIRQAAKKKADKVLVDETAKNIRYLRALKTVLLKPLTDTKPKIHSQNTVSEFVQLVRLEQLLMGQPDSRPEIESLRKMSTEQLVALLNQLESS